MKREERAGRRRRRSRRGAPAAVEPRAHGVPQRRRGRGGGLPAPARRRRLPERGVAAVSDRARGEPLRRPPGRCYGRYLANSYTISALHKQTSACKKCSNPDSEAVQLLMFGTSEHMRHELFQQLMLDHNDHSFVEYLKDTYRSSSTDGNDESPPEQKCSTSASVSFQDAKKSNSDFGHVWPSVDSSWAWLMVTYGASIRNLAVNHPTM